MVHTVLRFGSLSSLRPTSLAQCLQPPTYRFFTSVTTLRAKSLPPRATLPDSDVHHVFLKGGGPGGQKINKTNSKVQLTHLPTGIVVNSQATRSRTENYKIARRILAEKIEHLEKGDESRVAKKAEKKVARKRSKEKKARRKYRALEAAKRKDVDDVEESDDDTDGRVGGGQVDEVSDDQRMHDQEDKMV